MGKLLPPPELVPSPLWLKGKPPSPQGGSIQLAAGQPRGQEQSSITYDSADPFSSLGDFGKGIVD